MTSCKDKLENDFWSKVNRALWAVHKVGHRHRRVSLEDDL